MINAEESKVAIKCARVGKNNKKAISVYELKDIVKAEHTKFIE